MPDLLRIEVLVRCDPKDGNDPIEAVTYLPCVPVKGMIISVWVGDWQVEDEGKKFKSLYSDQEHYLKVDDVVLCAWAPERIEVWVESEDTRDLDLIRRIFTAIQNNEQP